MPAPSEEIERHAARWARDPKSRAFAQLADAYRKEGFLDEAIEICLQGLKDHPTYVSARIVLGRAYLEKGELDRAEGEFLRVLELDPENLLAHRLLGEIYLQQGRQAEARKCYEEVQRLNPFDREVKELLHTLPTAPTTPSLTGSEPGAIEVQPHLLTLSPPPPEEDSGGSVPEGSREIQDSLEGIPLSETLADLYIQQGLLDEAAALYRKLLEEDPSKEHLKRKLEALGELRRLPEDLSPARELLASRPGREEKPGGQGDRQWSEEVQEELVATMSPEIPQPREAPSGAEQRLLVIFEEWLEELRRLKAIRQRS